nr:asparaginase [Marinicella sp. W31]MDC2877993.1 asparaginase [Marinicella sp. W31]
MHHADVPCSRADFAKTGAEGVFCAALPEQGLGIALKCEDGTTRAAEVMIAAVFARLLGDDQELAERLLGIADSELKNWNGTEVGRVRAVLP